MLVRMFVRYYVELDLPVSRVGSALVERPGDWMPALVLDAERHGDELFAEVGLALNGKRVLGKVVRVEMGATTQLGEKTVLPMSWSATGPKGLFSVMEGDLEVAPLGADQTQLAMSARYGPPLGPLGLAADRAVLHRIAEATIKDFVERVGLALVSLVAASR
jgi:hypothetical protein